MDLSGMGAAAWVGYVLQCVVVCCMNSAMGAAAEAVCCSVAVCCMDMSGMGAAAEAVFRSVLQCLQCVAMCCSVLHDSVWHG